MAEPTGLTDSGADQGSTGQSADNNQGSNDSSTNQATNQSTDKTVSLEEYNKAKSALAEVLAKKDKYKGMAEKFQAEKEAAEKIAADNATDPEEQRKKYEDIISNKDTKYDELVKKNRRTEVSTRVKDVAVKLKAISSEQVLRYIKDEIIFDEGDRPVINDGKGEAAINKETGKILTIEEYVAFILTENPNFVQSSGNSGAGSSRGSAGQSGVMIPTMEDYQSGKITKEYWAKHGDAIKRQAERDAGIRRK